MKMYKFIFAFCALLLLQCTWGQLQSSDDFSSEFEIEGRTIFDDDLREFVEFCRLQMPCGYEPAGIPPLAPLKASYREIQFTTDRANISGNITNLIVEGLDDFDVRELHFNNVLRKVRYDFNFPEILFTGLYKADIITKLFGPAVHVYGDGKLNLTLKNLQLYGSFILRPKLSGGVRMTKFKINAELGDVESKLTGFMNSPLKTRLINAWIEEFISLTFNDSEDDVVYVALQRWAASPVNNALGKVSVVRVIELILGIIDGSLPQETLC